MVIEFVSSSFEEDFIVGKYPVKSIKQDQTTLEQVAHLRINIFREYPYLYDGNLDYERKYLKTYEESEDGIVILARDGDKAIGAITGVALKDSLDELKKSYSSKEATLEQVYYLGEVVLLKEYRGKNIGIFLYEALERYVKSKKKYVKIIFAAIKQENKGVAKENFYKKLGFTKRSDISLSYYYKKIGDEEESESKMDLWEKTI